MSSLNTEELQALYDDLGQIRLVNYVTLSCLAFLVYDILTNLDKEIPLIWRYYHNTDGDEHIPWRGRARRILVQTLFIFGRYYAPLYLTIYFAGTASTVFFALCLLLNGMPVNNHQGFSVPAESCKDYYYYLLFGEEASYSILVNVILAIRHNAMYQIFYGTEGLRKRQVFLASVVTSNLHPFQAVIIVCATTAAWVEKRVIEPPAGIPWPGCMLSANPNTIGVSCFTVAIFLGLTLRLLYSSMKLRVRRGADFTISNVKEEIRNMQPVTLTLVRDSVLFYFPLGILVASVPVVAIYRSNLANVTAPIYIALYSFCASRLIIHTREIVTRSSDDAPSREIEPMHFASRSLMASHAESCA
ncbi:hypothetical protein BKA83DRAFT_4284103 [Pisolithus microcarpus]|nr:hypothetical protein BKA83DRAFT_4284103 [Pisolithus microcarpus]